jgi:radical SAM-linked protein
MPDIVQRWRVVYRRGEAAAGLAQRGELEAWEEAVAGSGLQVAVTGGPHPRPRLAMAPPLPAGLTGERELLDILLVERRTSAEVRERLLAVAPPDHALVELFDVWVGAPPLPAQVVAVDYALGLRPTVGHDALRGAVARVLAAPRLERIRRKGERETRYDLRPFIVGLAVERSGPAGGALRMRLAVHPEQGTGRPDEVVAAVADQIGEPLEVSGGVRTRVWTADEVMPPTP